MAMYRAKTDQVAGDTIRFGFESIARPGRALSVRDVHALWRSDDDFCAVFSAALAETPLEAFFWETPPLTPASFDLPFECVVVPAPSLARSRADSRAFAAQFAAAPTEAEIISFDNLGGDASLVVPLPVDTHADYAHLAAFLRTAPAAQIRDLWRLTSEAAALWLANGRTCWISTSGLGVTWLHIRLDSRPKYYSHAPYRAARP